MGSWGSGPGRVDGQHPCGVQGHRPLRGQGAALGGQEAPALAGSRASEACGVKGQRPLRGQGAALGG